MINENDKYYNIRNKIEAERRKEEEKQKRLEKKKISQQKQEEDKINKRINKYNLEEIRILLCLLALSKDFDRFEINNINYNNKMFSIVKENTYSQRLIDNINDENCKLVIKCNDGRCLTIKATFVKHRVNRSQLIGLYRDATFLDFEYNVGKNSKIKFHNYYGEIGPEELLDIEAKDLERNSLGEKLDVKYDNKDKDYYVDLDTPNTILVGYRVFEFKKDYIKYDDNYISKDGKVLLRIGDENILPIEKVMNSNALNRTMISDFYLKELPYCREAIKAKREVNRCLKYKTYSKDEFLVLINELSKEVKKQLKEQENLGINVDEKISKLILKKIEFYT